MVDKNLTYNHCSSTHDDERGCCEHSQKDYLPSRYSHRFRLSFIQRIILLEYLFSCICMLAIALDSISTIFKFLHFSSIFCYSYSCHIEGAIILFETESLRV